MKKKLLISIAFCLLTITIFSQNTWKQTTISTTQKEVLLERNIPLKAKVFSLNMDSFKSQLSTAPQRNGSSKETNTIIEIPNRNGDLIKYRIQEASVFAPELQERYPEIRAYAGYAIDDASTYIRFTISPYNGMNGIVLKGNRSQTEIIEVVPGDVSKSIIFKRSDRKKNKTPFECTTDDNLHVDIDRTNKNQAADDSILRTFDLAMSVTGEYSAFHGGTLGSVNAAIATTVARQNSIFEIDFAVTLILVATNDDIVYLDGATDPYDSVDDSNYNSTVQSTITAQIGEANYDVGHLMAGIGNNGNAGCIGCVCVDNQKGSGYTTSTNPIGDTFDVDYVAHELGHQFGGNHTWTHGGNEGYNAQMEPGSGSTIMSYAGITGATDVQANVDPYFHAISIQQITDHAKSRTCDVETGTGNNIPVVDAGANITLPIGTPFRLTGSATDNDGADILTYCWEQFDEDNAVTTYPDETSTNSNSVLFRSYNPTTSPIRTFPVLTDLLAGGVNGNTWERIPTVSRNADFRLTVRDNRAGGAGNSFGEMIVTWDATRGPLEITSQATSGIVWNGGTTEDIFWDVNSTNLMTGAATVDILLSIDGGLTYPTTLASGVANDGSETITVPSTPAPYCRIIVQPTGAPFFAINTEDFSIDYLISTTCDELFTSTPNAAIPDNDPTFSTDGLNSTSVKTFGSGVFLKAGINVTHTYINDLRFDILSPDGTQLTLINQVCGGENDIDVTFFDSAGAIVCASPTTGDVAPAQAFTALDGETAGGTWTIGFMDLAGADTGTLVSWNVEICETVETALAVEDNSFAQFNVYPNPSNGKVNINLSSLEDVQISLFDISGRMLYSQKHNNYSGLFNKEINFGKLSSGVYLLKILSGDKEAVKKLIIQ
ncbi:MAG: zinc-dependent metalloprotease family protein [Urechidicola sp.]|nr:zinc-dependent metalloprotease family protein [Urechidicola sp.]